MFKLLIRFFRFLGRCLIYFYWSLVYVSSYVMIIHVVDQGLFLEVFIIVVDYIWDMVAHVIHRAPHITRVLIFRVIPAFANYFWTEIILWLVHYLWYDAECNRMVLGITVVIMLGYALQNIDDVKRRRDLTYHEEQTEKGLYFWFMILLHIWFIYFMVYEYEYLPLLPGIVMLIIVNIYTKIFNWLYSDDEPDDDRKDHYYK